MPGEYESFVSIDIWTMIFAWCNIVILYFFLKKLLFGPIQKMIDERQKQISGLYSAAEKEKATADSLKSEYEEKLGHAKEQSEEILKNATERAQKQEEEILRAAKEEAARTRARAEEQIALERTKAMNQLKNEVSDMAVDIASALIEKNLSKDDNAAMIDSFIEKLGE